MRIFAMSDLHLNYASNTCALKELPFYPEDALLLVGDIGESLAELQLALELCSARFARVAWVPGNHELYSLASADRHLRGVAKYAACVALCRQFGVLTPEDPFPVWETETESFTIAPLFVLYDYSFRPPEVAAKDVVTWAAADGVYCNDERYLHPEPYKSRQDWCAARCALSLERLEAALHSPHRLIIMNHHPLRQDLVRIPRIPRLSPWCGTKVTEDWHKRFRAAVVVSGHLHVRATDWRDGVRFEEVSIGSPRDWRTERGLAAYLRPILPAASDLPVDTTQTVWRYAD
jgi:predicted phosphodiesterase